MLIQLSCTPVIILPHSKLTSLDVFKFIGIGSAKVKTSASASKKPSAALVAVKSKKIKATSN